MPTEEPLAQMLAEPHMTHEAFGLRRHVSRRSDHDNALGMPALSLCERQRSAPQGMPDCQRGTTVATPNRMNRVDEVRKRAQLAGAATVSWLIKRDYGQTCLA
jgi:hypothetical protein